MTAARQSGEFAPPDAVRSANPWRALWAMLVGFFMILVDSTIVAVANPSIMEALETDYDAVIWVTSAYLLAYAVPLLVAGRLGDRFGPKNLYLIGLAIFTVASLGCGLAGSVETLILARVVQGLGAALLTPQTLSTITRIFPPERRGVAMSLWGATAGVATLVGPLAGGVLVDSLGWQWIFFVNVPIGIIGLGLAYWLVPVLPTNRHRFDLLGVALSGVAMFLIVFALQEGQTHDWALWIWAMIASGLVMMAGFIYWQAINKAEPLIPLSLFRDRNFSLANVGIAVIGFAVTAMILPLMFYAQAVCGLTPTRSALLTAPMAIASGVLAPVVGRIVDRAHPRPIVGFGFSVLAVSLTWLSVEMTPTTPIWRLVLPFTAMGVGMAFIWAPLAATATRNLPQKLAGAGSGVYNATRQVGSVLGSASMAAFMTSQISAELPGAANQGSQSDVRQLPPFLHEPFASAMSQSMLLPAFIALFGIVAAVFLVSGRSTAGTPAAVKARAVRAPSVDDYPTDVIDAVKHDPDAGYRKTARGDADYSDEFDDYDYDDGDYDGDDEYVEYAVEHSAPLVLLKPQLAIAASPAQPMIPSDDSITEPIPLPATPEPEYDDYDDYDSDYDEDWQADIADAPHDPQEIPDERPAVAGWRIPDPVPVDAWDSFLDNLKDDLRSMGDQPIGHAHNGFHVDDEDDVVQPLDVPRALGAEGHNGSTNGHVNGFDERHGSEFLNGLGFAGDNGYFAHLDNGDLDNGASAPLDSEPSSRHAGDEPPSRHYRPDPEPEPAQWHGYPDAREAGSDSREDDQGVPSYGSHSSAARHHRGDDEDSGFGFGAHRYEPTPQASPEPSSGSWRFVDGTWKYETDSEPGRHSSGPEDSGRGRHGRD